MASASIRFFLKDADVVKDADADQCKRTFTQPNILGQSQLSFQSLIYMLLIFHTKSC